ncbi:putative lipase ATG15 [Hypsizygus marmoreus]|uniref:triacylglycerol lipase n=1 Tax=Hypsizygus marmoreus TaxID=39966 RepID=A0A369JP57_HYPMA|nr:putative lipase ATG15 [Hypsizygus marmoreus]
MTPLRSILFTLLTLSQITHAAHILSFNAQSLLRPNPNIDLDLLTGFTPTPSNPLPSSLSLKATPTTVYRPRSLDALHRARLRSLHDRESSIVEWDRVQVLGPDVRDRHTLAQLARMTGNAYALPGQKNWYEVDPAWNRSFPFGWEDSDGFRGHVFMSSDNSTVVLSIKGTTLNGPTSKKDRFNDNLLFSCCCARVDISWKFRTVCDCYAHNWRCDDLCLTNALIQDSLFYSIGVKLVDDLLHIHPSANVWLVGHSLGGALASLLGSTYGLPAVAFESPGERLAASRLHLRLPPAPSSSSSPSPSPFPSSSSSSSASPHTSPHHHPVAVTHVYHTADPIPQGTCTGFGSPCAQAGYALETRCHLGKSIVFDTVGRLGWKVDVRRHVIREVIRKVLEGVEEGWGEEEGEEEEGDGDGDGEDGGGEEGERERERDVPRAKVEEGCVDCYKWEFGPFKDPDDE